MSADKDYLKTADAFATKVWEAISIAAFLSGDKNETWLRKAVKEFEEAVRADERERQDIG